MITLCCLLMTACSKKEEGYQGYIENYLRYMASNYSGVLNKLSVYYGDPVKQGQTLFMLDQWPEIGTYKESMAKLVATETDIVKFTRQAELAKAKLERRKKLGIKKFADQEEIDDSDAQYVNLIGQLESAKANANENIAQMDSANWSYHKKTIASSVNGTVFDIYYREGEFVPAGKPVLSVLAPQDIKIIFFIPQKELGKIRMHQPVIVTCDSCDNPIKANISFISPKAEFTPPIIYSNETKTKLVFMVEALTNYETSKKLHPGQPVMVKLQ